MERQLPDNSEKKEELWELELYINSIKEVVLQLQLGKSIKSCRCSYFPLRTTIETALGWWIWEKFRLIKYWNEDIIVELATMFINNKKQWEIK